MADLPLGVDFGVFPFSVSPCVCLLRGLDPCTPLGLDYLIDDPGVAAVRLTTGIRHRAVPNPANPRTEIRCNLPWPAHVALSIHDARGRVVWRGSPQRSDAGPVSLAWSGRDAAGRDAASGVYFYRVLADGAPVAMGKLALVR